MSANHIAVIAVLVLMAVGAYGWRRLMRACDAAQVADWGRPWLNRLDGLNRIFCRRFHRLHADRVPIPQTGPALVVANHVSGLDPLLMIAASPRPLHFLIAREQYDRWWLRWLFDAIGCIPVTRHAPAARALARARAALERGEIVALFPHGRMHLDHEPPIPLKRGVVYLAAQTGAPIVAMRLEGVRGEGMTVPAVLLRSRVRLKSFPPFHYTGDAAEEFLQRLARALASPHPPARLEN